MRFKSFRIGKSKEKPEPAKETAQASDISVTQIDSLGEHLNNRTKSLEATEQQLRELSSAANDSAKVEGAAPQPHGPLVELEVEPEELEDEETDISTLLGETKKEAKVAEAKAGAATPAIPEKKSAKEENSDSLNSLFSQDDDEENPLAHLISALPDVTAQELLDDLREIKE